jgi:hypothetical protein
VLARRSPGATVLGDLPARSRAALLHMADFFNTPAGPGLIQVRPRAARR